MTMVAHGASKSTIIIIKLMSQRHHSIIFGQVWNSTDQPTFSCTTGWFVKPSGIAKVVSYPEPGREQQHTRLALQLNDSEHHLGKLRSCRWCCHIHSGETTTTRARQHTHRTGVLTVHFVTTVAILCLNPPGDVCSVPDITSFAPAASRSALTLPN